MTKSWIIIKKLANIFFILLDFIPNWSLNHLLLLLLFIVMFSAIIKWFALIKQDFDNQSSAISCHSCWLFQERERRKKTRMPVNIHLITWFSVSLVWFLRFFKEAWGVLLLKVMVWSFCCRHHHFLSFQIYSQVIFSDLSRHILPLWSYSSGALTIILLLHSYRSWFRLVNKHTMVRSVCMPCEWLLSSSPTIKLQMWIKNTTADIRWMISWSVLFLWLTTERAWKESV